MVFEAVGPTRLHVVGACISYRLMLKNNFSYFLASLTIGVQIDSYSSFDFLHLILNL